MITDKPFTWNIAFHSGMSAKSDLRAAVDEGVAVGVVATLLDVSKAILVLPRHLDAGGSSSLTLAHLQHSKRASRLTGTKSLLLMKPSSSTLRGLQG